MGWPAPRASHYTDFDTVNLRYKGYERFSNAWTDPRGVFGVAPIKPEGGFVRYDDHPFGAVGPDGVTWFDEKTHVAHPLHTDDEDGCVLTSAAHPGSEAVTKEEVDFIEAGGWTCAKGHPYCNCCPGPDLTEASLEQLCIDIQKVCGDRDVILRKPRLFVGTRRFP